MGFMSMVRLTQNQPRGSDGLPMERVRTPFGPFFRGLPSGLDLTLWLDGDSVARAEAASAVVRSGLAETWPCEAAELPERLMLLDPLSPTAYRLLAARALESAAGGGPSEVEEVERIAALELERAASHLSWLAALGYLLGSERMRSAATQLHSAVQRAASPGATPAVHREVKRLIRRVERDPLLRRRLADVGTPDPGDMASVTGPTARAAGHQRDVRLEEPAYRRLGFEPVVRQGGDAWARLLVRLGEIEHSLWLAGQAEPGGQPSFAVPPGLTGEGEARIEAPRGEALLRVRIEAGIVRHVELEGPSATLIKLAEKVAAGTELADSLVAVASLDISPWEAG